MFTLFMFKKIRDLQNINDNRNLNIAGLIQRTVLIKTRCEKDGLDFERLNRPSKNSSNFTESTENAIEDAKNECESKQDSDVNSSFYERGRPVIKDLEANKILAAIELYVLVKTDTEEKAGELIWALLEKEVESPEDSSAMKELWYNSTIQMDIDRSPKSTTKMTIKVDEIYADKPFIHTIWQLLKDVCYRTGMTIVAIYGEENVMNLKVAKKKHIS